MAAVTLDKTSEELPPKDFLAIIAARLTEAIVRNMVYILFYTVINHQRSVIPAYRLEGVMI